MFLTDSAAVAVGIMSCDSGRIKSYPLGVDPTALMQCACQWIRRAVILIDVVCICAVIECPVYIALDKNSDRKFETVVRGIELFSRLDRTVRSARIFITCFFNKQWAWICDLIEVGRLRPETEYLIEIVIGILFPIYRLNIIS